MKIAMLSPVAWRTPPRHYGPWEQIVHLLTEGLCARGIDVTLFATADSVTSANLASVCPRGWEEDKTLEPKVAECLHISHLIEQSDRFDLIHNHFDFLPLTYSQVIRPPMITTIHGFSSPKILPVYKQYNGRVHYVSISHADRSADLTYIANVYHGIVIEDFPFRSSPGDYLLFFGRIHPEKGAHEAIEIARTFGMKLIIAGIVQDREYYEKVIAPEVDGDRVQYLGSVGPNKRGEILAGAYALLHMISFDEPFGLSMVEAMACGTPVIARPRGSIGEIVLHGETGFHVQTIAEAVAALQKVDRIDRSRCREWVYQQFHRDRMVDDYVNVYREVLIRGSLEESVGESIFRPIPSHKKAKVISDRN